MPGIVVFRRRWAVGSDDLVVPGIFLFTTHLIWTGVLGTLLAMADLDHRQQCALLLWQFSLAYLVTLSLSLVIELAICIVAMRGSILNTAPRVSMQYLLYVRIFIMLGETALLVAGVYWLVYYYKSCPVEGAKETVLSLIVCNWCIIFSVLITVWCTYDAAGRSWVKMKQFQRSMKEERSKKYQYKRSGNTHRNWRQRKVIRAYQDRWDQRCRFLFCCMRPSDRNRNSFADIARLLSDFFRDLDVVPSDVVAGLVLLRKFQKIEQKAIVEQRKNGTYEFLSGVAITPKTQFLALQDPDEEQLFQTVIRYMHFALGAYGWPVFLMTYSATGLCQLCTKFRCCCIPYCGNKPTAEPIDDNCCRCNYAALEQILTIGDVDIIYVTYHVDVGETPFYVAIDYDRRKIVISIRGTLSLQDVITDLNAEGDTLPLNPPREDWIGHKGMIQAAEYIRNKLVSENLLQRAFERNPEKGTRDFGLVLVGHSLGAGAASILAILLKQDYIDLQCYSYSPPGGLLSMPAVEYSKSFIISVVLGKDVVPRIGLHQMETLRADLINAIKRSVDPKWKTIACNLICCCCGPEPTSANTLSSADANIIEYIEAKEGARTTGTHPNDSSIALTLHNPLYPPGRIIHIVRHHPKKGEIKYEKRWRQAISSREPVYQALWAQNTDFDEVLISPVMIQDHMPDTVLDALNKVITTFGPRKPQRNQLNGATELDSEHCQLLDTQATPKSLRSALCLETSFAALHSPNDGVPSSIGSSVDGYHSSRSQGSPIQLTSVLTILDEKLKRKPDRRGLGLNLRKVDLIYDEWYGLAPLASPESLSEVSSISSKTGHLDSFYELKTPKILRRTPKIPGNLSTCADDIRSVRYYQKLAQNSKVRCPSRTGSYTSSELSYESATSAGKCPSRSLESDSFQSAENILERKSHLGDIHTVYEQPEVAPHSENGSGQYYCTSGVYCNERLLPLGHLAQYSSSSGSTSSNARNVYCADPGSSYSSSNSTGMPQFGCSPTDTTGLCRYYGVGDRSGVYHLEHVERRLEVFGVDRTSSSTSTDSKNCDELYRRFEAMSAREDVPSSSRLDDVHRRPGTSMIPIPQVTVSSGGPPTQRMIYMETHFDEDPFRSDVSQCSRSPRSALDSSITSRSPRGGLDIRSCLTRAPRSVSEGSSTPQVLSPSTPQELDPDIVSNFAMDLNLEEENRSHYFHPGALRREDAGSKPNSVDSGSICRTPSEPKCVSFNPQVVNIDPRFVVSGSSPTRFERWRTKRSELWQLLPGRNRKPKVPPRPEAEAHKAREVDERFFSRNESLPLLSGLPGAQAPSPNFVRRKKYVYPITSIGRGESSV